MGNLGGRRGREKREWETKLPTNTNNFLVCFRILRIKILAKDF
jgi:hypothetical protein